MKQHLKCYLKGEWEFCWGHYLSKFLNTILTTLWSMYLLSPFFEWGTWEAEILSKVPQLLGSRAGWKKKWKSHPTLCNPMDCSLPGSFVHGISQSRILERVVISFSKGSFWPGDQTLVTGRLQIFYHCRQILYHLSHQGSPSRVGTWSQIHLMPKSMLLLGRALLSSKL